MQKKVLIVDDEPDILKSFSTALEQNGFIPVTAEDGLEGLKSSREEKPDLILLNLMMPEKTGIRMYTELKKDESLKNIPVVVVTRLLLEEAQMQQYWRRRRFLPGPEGHLQKPVEPNNLIKAVRKLLFTNN